MDLPGRGTTFVRLRRPDPGQPTVLLLHGLGVTADANWFPAYPPLADRFGVVAIDHRGHGRGIRTERPVRLADCADDAVALLDVLGIERFGASAPGDVTLREYGFTVEHVCTRALAMLR